MKEYPKQEQCANKEEKHIFICASCNQEFNSLEEMQEHWRKIGILKK